MSVTKRHPVGSVLRKDSQEEKSSDVQASEDTKVVKINFGSPAQERIYGVLPRLPPKACATFAAEIDAMRVSAGIRGKTFVYTIHLEKDN